MQGLKPRESINDELTELGGFSYQLNAKTIIFFTQTKYKIKSVSILIIYHAKLKEVYHSPSRPL